MRDPYRPFKPGSVQCQAAKAESWGEPGSSSPCPYIDSLGWKGGRVLTGLIQSFSAGCTVLTSKLTTVLPFRPEPITCLGMAWPSSRLRATPAFRDSGWKQAQPPFSSHISQCVSKTSLLIFQNIPRTGLLFPVYLVEIPVIAQLEGWHVQASLF